MSSFSWLHISDLHRGLKPAEWLWPEIERHFLDDLGRLAKWGPWDLILFTGDLTQKGAQAEFEKLDEPIERIKSRLKELAQQEPVLLCVPGNHDLVRPAPELLERARLEAGATEGSSWLTDPSSEMRRLVRDAFQWFTKWQEAHRPQGPGVRGWRQGLLPGDFSMTYEKQGRKLGIVGLNSAWLQLRAGDMKGMLALSPAQFHALAGPEWSRQHDACILLTHHPADWLDAASQSALYEEIAPAGRFSVHLFGHMHEGRSESTSSVGAPLRHEYQAASLCGLELYETPDGRKLARSHGYAAGRIDFADDEGRLWYWPRIASRIGRVGWKVGPDQQGHVLGPEEAVVTPLRSNNGRPMPISTFFELEDLLHRVVFEANRRLSGDGCSVFLWDDDSGRFVLRESTVMTPFIGRDSLDPQRDLSVDRCGITTHSAISNRPVVVPDVRQDVRWSWYQQEEPGPRAEHCELSVRELGSMTAVPFPNERGEPAGVLRVVRKREREPFNDADLKALRDFVDSTSRDIVGALSLGRLVEVGCVLDAKELCERAVAILARMVAGKGASVFLLDETMPRRATSTYRCIASTGLTKPLGAELRDCVYLVPDEKQTSITAFVASEKRNVVLDNMATFDFETQFGMKRPAGSGKYAELAIAGHGGMVAHTGPFMATPLFFREQFDPGTPAMGVIRVTRQQGDAGFGPGEQRRFFAFAEKLSKTIRQARYIALLNDLSVGGGGGDEKFHKVVREVPRLIGGKGCSVFTGTRMLRMRATSGALEGAFRSNKIAPYDLRDAASAGYTSAAAIRNEAILWNNEAERRSLEGKGIRHSQRNECEVAEKPPTRFLCVPMDIGIQVVGVVRVPKTKHEGPFSLDDQRMLQSIANHLGRLIASSSEVARRDRGPHRSTPGASRRRRRRAPRRTGTGSRTAT